MNFLLLCQTAGQLAGIPNIQPGVLPSSISGSSREMQKMAAWINMAWNEIQRQREDWHWMRKAFSFQTVANTQEYSPAAAGITDFAKWRNDSFRLFLTSAGVGTEIWLQQYDYNSFRDYYLLGARKITYARPIAVSVTPDKKLSFGLAPDNIYTVSGEYFKSPSSLINDTDEPDIPSRFHWAVVHKALIKYGIDRASGEIIQENQALYNALMTELMADQTDEIVLGGSLI